MNWKHITSKPGYYQICGLRKERVYKTGVRNTSIYPSNEVIIKDPTHLKLNQV